MTHKWIEYPVLLLAILIAGVCQTESVKAQSLVSGPTDPAELEEFT